MLLLGRERTVIHCSLDLFNISSLEMVNNNLAFFKIAGIYVMFGLCPCITLYCPLF